ncbi:ribonuclease D [Kordiimonas marina]|uniref:ribonuclease D n=1 Tax=Kordiimonas marina TaxID=2872312 RepID=UPI001FF52D66|nr:ribonuclease D [Kordiimonas marina]MCJ9428920.1 ribonuclease D [Kordiimonas marina]
MHPITRTEDLEVLCQRLKKASFVTVDTEFLRDNTYYPKLCLVQVADDEDAHAIDPLAEGIDLQPLFDLLADQNVLKVMHACRQDMEIFALMMDTLPAPIFDTQVAAMVCGFGDSVGYETLVTKITKKPLDKSARYTDWSKRPLSDTQLHYALGDVTYLRDIYRHLDAELTDTGRRSWVEEEMAVLRDPGLYRVEPEDAWLRLKVRTNKPRFLGLLKELAAWRERQAQERDLPRNRVAKDETLFEIAAHPPKDETAVDRIRGIPKGFSRSRAGKSLLQAIEAGLEIPEDDLPHVARAKPRPATPPMADLLKVLLKIKCQEAKVAPRMVANAHDIESWAAEPDKVDIAALHGWRREIFGADALKLMAGTLALTAHKGDIDVVELEEDAAD